MFTRFSVDKILLKQMFWLKALIVIDCRLERLAFHI